MGSCILAVFFLADETNCFDEGLHQTAQMLIYERKAKRHMGWSFFFTVFLVALAFASEGYILFSSTIRFF